MPHLNAITAGDPAGRLNQPHPPKEFEDPNKILNSIGDALSPGYWTSKILEETIGYNPLKEVSKYVAGDWESFAEVGDVGTFHTPPLPKDSYTPPGVH